MSICSGIARPLPTRVCTDQYNTRFMFSDADLLEMHRRMLVIRGFEERVAALYRDGEVPGLRAPVDRAGGVGGRRVLAARPDRRDHVDAPRPRPLPREGSRPARDVRRADGQGRGHEPRARRLDAHRRSDDRHLRRQRDRRRRPADRGRAPRPRRSCARDGSVAVAFFGDGAVAHGTFHEAINLAAVWQLPVIFFCENNGYAEFSPAAAQHAAPLEQRAAGYGVDYVAVDGNDVVATATAMRDGGRRGARRARSRRRRGRRPTAGTVTTKATRSATGRPTKCGSGKRATRCSCTRAGSGRRASPTTRSTSMQAAVAQRARRRGRRGAAADARRRPPR